MSRMLAPAALLVLLAAGSALPSVAAERLTPADWPQFRGPNRDDHSPDQGLLKTWPRGGPPVAWKATGTGAGFSGVSVSGGKVFTMGDRASSENGKEIKACQVIALNQADGKELWAAKVGKAGGNFQGPRCTPTVEDGLVYALGQFGDLVCLDAATGKERWRKNLPGDFKGQSGGWNYTESPLVDGDRLVCTPGGNQHTIVALNKQTGDIVPGWKGALPGGDTAGYSSIVISEAAGQRQYVQLLAGGVAGVAASDGTFLWRYDKLGHNTANIPTPIVRGDYVFCSAGYGKGGALLKLTVEGNGVKAAEVYYNPNLKNKHGGIVLVGDCLYGDRDDSGNPWCADFKTGQVAAGWAKKADKKGSGSASLTYADGYLYWRYDNGWVALVKASPEAYQESAAFKIPDSTHQSWPHPVVVGGRLYLREQETLWCYDVKQH